ncbi:MAG: c-type cytochrome [Nitriliruptoraceae bacterium]
MRHHLIDRLVVIISASLVAASLVFALAANSTGSNRVDEVLGLDPDLDRGRELYITFEPSCASCHSFRDAGASSIIASDLDELQPSARVSAQSLLGGGIAGHDRENYEHILSNQDIADVVRYIEEYADR